MNRHRMRLLVGEVVISLFLAAGCIPENVDLDEQGFPHVPSHERRFPSRLPSAFPGHHGVMSRRIGHLGARRFTPRRSFGNIGHRATRITRRHRSLEDDADLSKLTKPPGCPENVLAYEVPIRAAKLFVHCEWEHPDEVNLMVVEPGGEKCWFDNELTKSGGSIDTTTGGVTGREAYLSGEGAPKGTYQILACHAEGKGPISISVVVQQNARMEGWTADRFVIDLPAADKEKFYPVAAIEIK